MTTTDYLNHTVNQVLSPGGISVSVRNQPLGPMWALPSRSVPDL